MLALFEEAGTGCSTSQCSTTLPSSSKRKMSNTRGFLASPVQVAHVYKSQMAVDGDAFDLAGYAPGLLDVAHDGIEPIREKRVVLEISPAHETRIQVGLA